MTTLVPRLWTDMTGWLEQDVLPRDRLTNYAATRALPLHPLHDLTRERAG